jgi:hypothetical protein
MNHSGRILAPVGVSTEAGEDHADISQLKPDLRGLIGAEALW